MPSEESNGSGPVGAPDDDRTSDGDTAEWRLYPAIDEARAGALSPIVAGLVATVADAVPELPFDVDVPQYYTLLQRFADSDE